LDKDFALAYTRLAQINLDFWWHFFDRDSSRLYKSSYFIEKAMEISPDLPETRFAKGNYYYHGFREYDKALDEFFEVFKMRPNDFHVLAYIGYVKRRQGEFLAAIEWLGKANEADPMSVTAVFSLGETNTLIRNYEDGIKYFDQAISMVPDWNELYNMKAKCQLLSDQGIGEVKNTLLYAHEDLNIHNDLLLLELVKLYLLDKDWNQALALLNQVAFSEFDLQFSYVPRDYLLAKIYQGLQQDELKLASLNAALKVTMNKIEETPGDGRLHSALGLIYAELGQFEKAIEEGELATKLIPIKLDAWVGYDRELILARIYTISGEYDLALEKIDYLLSIPGMFSISMLELDYVYDPLRDLSEYDVLLNKYED